MRCDTCGGALVEVRLEGYPFTESGLDDVTLVGVTERRCVACGESEVVLPRLKELHRTIASALAAKGSRLTGREQRFLRRHLGFSQADYAQRINVRAETVSRWETEAEEISWHFELLLRTFVMLGLKERNYDARSFDDVAPTRAPAQVRIYAEDSSWRADRQGALAAGR